MLRSIGVLIHEQYLAEYTTFYWKMYQELALVATDKNCMAAVEILKHDMEDHQILPRMVEENQVEGLIVMGEISREYIRFMKEQTRIPIIFLDFYDKELAEDAVISDNFYGMYLLTELLFERGYRKLAYVGSIHRTSSIMDRYCGFHKAMLEHGEDLPEEWLIEDRDRLGNIEFSVPEKLPEAFVCNCDLTAGRRRHRRIHRCQKRSRVSYHLRKPGLPAGSRDSFHSDPLPHGDATLWRGYGGGETLPQEAARLGK